MSSITNLAKAGKHAIYATEIYLYACCLRTCSYEVGLRIREASLYVKEILLYFPLFALDSPSLLFYTLPSRKQDLSEESKTSCRTART